jgi:hypothetical protein
MQVEPRVARHVLSLPGLVTGNLRATRHPAASLSTLLAAGGSVHASTRAVSNIKGFQYAGQNPSDSVRHNLANSA